MARRQDIVRSAEKYASFLLYEATGGAMGRAPISKKKVSKVSENSKDEFRLDFQTKRALLDSLIKLASLKAKVSPDDGDEDGISHYKEMLNDTTGSGTDTSRGTTDTPTVSNATPPIHGQPNGHASHDFLE